MSIEFPRPEGVLRCPYHRADSAFCTDKEASADETVITRVNHGPVAEGMNHQIKARWCRTCGMPLDVGTGPAKPFVIDAVERRAGAFQVGQAGAELPILGVGGQPLVGSGLQDTIGLVPQGFEGVGIVQGDVIKCFEL